MLKPTKKTVLLAEATRKSEILRGEGDSESIAIYADAFERDSGFYSFYRSMQAYKNVFRRRWYNHDFIT